MPDYNEIYNAMSIAVWALRDKAEEDGNIEFWNENRDGYEAIQVLSSIMTRMEYHIR